MLVPIRWSLCLAALCGIGCQSTQNGASSPSPSAPPPVPIQTATAEATTAAPSIDEAPPPKPTDPIETWFVEDKLVDCVGEGPMKCMRVRKGESGDTTLLYSPIEGFSHEPGFTYELKVEVTDVAEPMADASSKRYRLVEVVSKTEVK